MTALFTGEYQVEGKLIEVTSEEKGTEKAAATRPITLKVVEIEGEFRIAQVELADYE